ncbi:glucose kinase [Thermoplasma volcanium GSS1]|uniref:Glucose kinase n=1 Tax=Thermoplasma volcanium (strain ATCC 51530 / DSM 4299 / JCM 9571 / NBRC 15438 / GSS1) TaxID=273116 RepID=Q97AS0_THEVO|nr:ROK family protein [Thermoplasma volcanium]BAB59881.1 glucose kinase [Thermoplasma volcanium GSS1]
MALKILGYDVGGTKISTVVGNDNGNILSNVRMPTVKHLGKKRLIEEMITMGDAALKKAGVDKPDMIGIIFAGPVDNKKGVVIASPNIFGLSNFNIVEPIQKYYGAKTYLENDATAAAIAERLFGSGKNVDNFVYMTLSTGIGGGIFINGKLYKGAHGMAGELGHSVIMVNGPTCGCGRRGCLEALAGGKAIARRVIENLNAVRDSNFFSRIRPTEITAEKVFEGKKKGDMFSQLILEETIYYLAVGIVNIINILDPELVIIGGGISKAGKDLFDPLNDAIREEFKSMYRPFKIVPGLENGSDLAAISVPLYKESE